MSRYPRNAFLTLLSLTLFVGCAQDSSGVKKFDITKAPFDIEQEGASSGGGGYSQQATHQMLEIAKDNLAEKILNSPDEFFVNFPEKYNKSYLAQIIKNIQFKPEGKDRVQRDGSYLKMDYDKETDTLYALHDFYIIYNFPSLMSLLKKPEKFRENLQNIQTDIMHELSHLLGVGTSATSNFTSEIFSEQFFLRLGSARYICENETYQFAFFPSKKAFLLDSKKNNNKNSLVKELKEFYPVSEADINEIFSSYERTQNHLLNAEYFWEEFELAELSKYYTNEKNEGSAFLWDTGINSILNTSFESTDSHKVFGFIFNDSKDGFSFESKILDEGKGGYSSSDPVKFDEYSQELFSHLQFNSDLSTAEWKYDLKVNFTNEPTEEQIKVLSDAQKERGQRNFTEKFSCQKITSPFPLEIFLKYPVNSVKDENFSKIIKELGNNP